MGFRGWHGVTDKSNNLLAVSYEPIEGTLACRFKSRQEPYLYQNVPENVYQILLRSPYAGSYFRKYVKDKYALLGEKLPPPFQGQVPPKILPKVVEVPQPETGMQMSLWGSRGSRKAKQHSTHS